MTNPAALFHDAQSAKESNSSLGQTKPINWTAIVCFAIALVVTASLIRSVIGTRYRSYGEILTEKADHLRLHAGDYDVIFLGTSHVYRSLCPAAFDEQLAQAGLKIKSYNAGVLRLSYPEAMYLLAAIEECPTKPKFIFFEPSLRLFDVSNWSTEREISIHNSKHTVQSLQTHVAAITESTDAVDAVAQVVGSVTHCGSYAANRLNYGAACRVILPELDQYAPRTYATPEARDAGFVALDDEFESVRKKRNANYGDSPEKFEKLLVRSHELREKERKSKAWYAQLYEQMAQRIQALGAQPVMFTTPRFYAGRHIIGDRLDELYAAENSTDTTRLDYRCGEGPDSLFQPKYWFDREHMNRAGAVAFSKLLAQDTLLLLESNFQALTNHQPQRSGS